MQCNFYSGQQVICINDDPFAPPNRRNALVDFLALDPLDGLRSGRIYTVRDVYIDYKHNMPCVTIEEIRRNLFIDNREFGFFAFRFRPLKKSNTSIEVFQEILRTNTIKKKKLEDA